MLPEYRLIKLMYTIEPDRLADETAWLKELKVYPSVEPYFDWIQNIHYVRFGMIVSPEAAVSIKMRHPVQFQSNYQGK